MRLMRTCVALFGCALGGCATVNHMAFDKDANSVDVSKKAVVLVAIEVQRLDDSRFHVVPLVVNVEKPNAQSKQDRQNFKVDKDQDVFVSEDGHTLFLTRMALEPGQYRLVAVTGFARAFPINAMFQIPLVADFNVRPGSITYLGRISATLRSRKSGEFRAGPLIPLIDQSVAGISTSTWDVTIENRADIDVPLYKKTFRALTSASIATAPLPPFDRAAAQRWWDHDSAQEKDKDKSAGAAAPPVSNASATGAQP
jgi:hypothetical protein